MGREVKRVPLNFDWPVNKTWEGYLNPNYVECTACKGSGETMAMKRLGDLVGLLMLSGSDSAEQKCHPYFHETPLYNSRGKTCGPDMAELTGALAGRQPRWPFGHDCVDRWSATRKIINAAGLPESWGRCPDCDGEGIPRDKIEIYESWQKSEPPEGEGWQVWETVSEGSPISPVFATPEELAAHMAQTRWGADQGTSYETWLKFIVGPGWAISGVMDSKGFRTGVKFAADTT